MRTACYMNNSGRKLVPVSPKNFTCSAPFLWRDWSSNCLEFCTRFECLDILFCQFYRILKWIDNFHWASKQWLTILLAGEPDSKALLGSRWFFIFGGFMMLMKYPIAFPHAYKIFLSATSSLGWARWSSMWIWIWRKLLSFEVNPKLCLISDK